MNKKELRRAVEQSETFVFGEKNLVHAKINNVTSYVKKSHVLKFVDQLEEPNPQLSGKEELLFKIGELRDAPEEDTSRDFDNGFDQALDHLEGFVMTLDEPKPEVLIAERTVEKEVEKPIVPQFVSEWFEKNKHDLEYGIYSKHYDIIKRGKDDRFDDWLVQLKNTPIETLIRMKNGYTLEEKKYRVLDKQTRPMLEKNDKGEVVIFYNPNPQIPVCNLLKKYELTEKEIKDYDERYWPFAVEV